MFWRTDLEGNFASVARGNASAARQFQQATFDLNASLSVLNRRMGALFRSVRGSSSTGFQGAADSARAFAREADQAGQAAARAGTTAGGKIARIGEEANAAASGVRRLNEELARTGGGEGTQARGGGRGTSFFGALGNAYFTYQLGRMAVDSAIGLGRQEASFLGYGIEQTSQKRGVLANLRGYLGGNAGAARAYYGQLQGIADLSPLERPDVLSGAQKFLGAGVGAQGAARLTTALSDLISNTSMAPGAFRAVTDIALRAITSPQGVTARTYAVLSQASQGFINQRSLVDALHKSKGITEGAAAARLGNIGTRAQAFVDAVIALAEKRDLDLTGNATLGGASRLFGIESVPGLFSTLHDRLREMFSDVDLKPLAEGLSAITDELRVGGPMMEEFKTSIQNTFTGILEPWLNEYRGHPERIHADLERVRTAMDDVGAAAGFLSGVLHTAFDWILPNVGETSRNRAGRISGGILNTLLFGTVPYIQGYTRPGLDRLGQSVFDLAAGGDPGVPSTMQQVFQPGATRTAIPASAPAWTVPFPAHGTGGLTTRPHPAIVGDSREIILPVDSPESRAALTRAMGGGGGPRVQIGDLYMDLTIHGANVDADSIQASIEERMLPLIVNSIGERLAIEAGG